MALKKRKTPTEHVWDLLLNGTKVGQAKAEYKTATQRTWVGKIVVPTEDDGSFTVEVTGLKSVKKVMEHLEQELADQNITDIGTLAEPVVNDTIAEVAAGNAPAMADLVAEAQRKPQAGSSLD